MYLTNSQQSREADRIQIEERGTPGYQLMQAAGKKSAEYILQHFSDQNLFLVLCGPGNNGGDGLVIARILHQSGKNVQALLSASPEKYAGDALLAYQDWKRMRAPETLWNLDFADAFHPRQPLLIDALLGTGIKGEVRGFPEQMIAQFRDWNCPCIAIDLPSGLSADTGEVFTLPIPSICTITFHSPKVCHAITPASKFCGEVVVADIGIGSDILEAIGVTRQTIISNHVTANLPPLESDAHKGLFGHAGLVGGSRNMAGAIALATHAALSVGAGLGTAFLPGAARCAFYQHTWASMTFPAGNDETEFLSDSVLSEFRSFLEGKKSIAIGPGLGNNAQTSGFLLKAIPHINAPLVLDADALNILGAYPELWEQLPTGTILTPHPGEMARLTGRTDINERRLEVAEDLAKTRNVIVVLKGAHTIVASPTGETRVNLTGNAGMATAGAGDVLTGAITGLLAQGLTPFDAACAGVFLHGLAGDLAAEKTGGRGTTAQTILDHLSMTFPHLGNPQLGSFNQI